MQIQSDIDMTLSDFSIKSLRELITGDSAVTPYQKGLELVDYFNSFGIRDVYGWKEGGLPDAMSRNQYAVQRYKDLNGTKQLQSAIERLVDSRRFAGTELEVLPAVEAINEIIKHDGYRLEDIDGIHKVVGGIEEDEITVEVHFADNQAKVIEAVSRAEFTIWVAVAWFTDPVLFNLLKKKAAEGVHVQVVILDDEINTRAGLDFENHFDTLRVPKRGYWANKMHHKFCVIDQQTVVHGSYNWTKAAQYNDETVSIESSKEIAAQYLREFKRLKQG